MEMKKKIIHLLNNLQKVERMMFIQVENILLFFSVFFFALLLVSYKV